MKTLRKTFQYGSFHFDWEFVEAPLKTHRITVEKGKAVLLRGKSISFEEQEGLIRKKARWIRSQILEMDKISLDEIVSGSRLAYLGRSYMVIIEEDKSQLGAKLEFNGSKFHLIMHPKDRGKQELIQIVIEQFQRQKALEKIYPRIKKWQKETGFIPEGYRINRMASKWGNCTPEGLVEINSQCIEKPMSVIDYVIVHELCHLKELNHTKAFWALLDVHYPQWEAYHKEIGGEV